MPAGCKHRRSEFDCAPADGYGPVGSAVKCPGDAVGFRRNRFEVVLNAVVAVIAHDNRHVQLKHVPAPGNLPDDLEGAVVEVGRMLGRRCLSTVLPGADAFPDGTLDRSGPILLRSGQG